MLNFILFFSFKLWASAHEIRAKTLVSLLQSLFFRIHRGNFPTCTCTYCTCLSHNRSRTLLNRWCHWLFHFLSFFFSSFFLFALCNWAALLACVFVIRRLLCFSLLVFFDVCIWCWILPRSKPDCITEVGTRYCTSNGTGWFTGTAQWCFTAE